jgi:hypothetical protein
LSFVCGEGVRPLASSFVSISIGGSEGSDPFVGEGSDTFYLPRFMALRPGR